MSRSALRSSPGNCRFTRSERPRLPGLAALVEAMRQIGENRYAVKLTEAEAGVIRGYAIVCWGKWVRVRVV